MRKLWRNYSLSIVLAGLFLVSWLAQLLVQLPEYAREQADHGQPFDTAGFLLTFWRSTLENWQSEFLQLLTFVVLTAVFIHRDSAESKDGDERLEAKVDQLLREHNIDPDYFS